MLIAGGVLFAVASLGCALAPDLTSLNIARFVQGIGSIAGMVTARAAIITLYPRPVAMRLLGVLSAVLALSPALGPLIGSLVQMAFDWRQGFVLLAIAVLIGSLGAGIAVRRTGRRPPSGSTVLASLGRLARSHRFRVGLGMVSITNASFVVFMAMAPFVFVERAGMAPLTFSAALAGCLVLFAISSVMTGRRAGPLGPRRAAMIGLPAVLIALIGLTASALTEASPWWAFAALALLFPGLGCMVPTGHMTMLAPFSDITGTAASIGLLAMTLAGALAVGLIGWLVPSSMLAIALVFAGAWLVTVRLVFWLPRTV
jgi:DHA1 family bicyclomycin/chloramphenicol resistance-like MFS transporter